MEGVTFAIRDNLAALNAAGTTISRVTAIGGGFAPRTLLAEVDCDSAQHSGRHSGGWRFRCCFRGGTLGLLAATGADPLSVCTAPKTAETVEPKTGRCPGLMKAYRRYRALYPAVKAAMNN